MTKINITTVILMIIFIVFNINLAGCRQTPEDEVKREVAVEVVEAIKGDIAEEITLSSRLQPKNNRLIFPKTPSGEVTKLAVHVGDTVKKGDFLFELDKEPVRRQVEMSKQNYEQAKKNYRLKNQQYQEAIAAMASNTPNEIMVFQQSRNIMEEARAAEAAVFAAEAQMEQARLNYITTLEQLEEMEYYAPMDGVVSQIHLQENHPVINTQPAMVITDTSQIKAELYVTKRLMDTLELGQRVDVYTEDIKEGRVSMINTVADPLTGLHLVEVLVNTTDGKLPDTFFCRITIEQQRKEGVLVIPKEAIFFQNNYPTVFIEENNRAYKREIQMGIDNGKMVEIIDGLKEGEKVIVKGQHYIDENTSLIVLRGEINEYK